MAELYFLVLFWYYIVVSMLIVSEKNSCVSVFGPFLVPKIVHFTFSQPVLGCMGLFSVHFIAKSTVATNFVYPCS
jgi:hypothetical protein